MAGHEESQDGLFAGEHLRLAPLLGGQLGLVLLGCGGVVAAGWICSPVLGLFLLGLAVAILGVLVGTTRL